MWHFHSGTCSYIGPVADMIRRALFDLSGCNTQEGKSYERWYVDLDAPLVRKTGMRVFDEANLPYARMVCGVALFDDLVWHQKLVLLAQVGRAMLSQSEPAPPRTAVLDSTAVAIFRFISHQIWLELSAEARGEPAPNTYRQLGYRMFEQCEFPDDWPGEPCHVDYQWSNAIHELQEQFFVTARYIDWCDEYLDAEPDRARELLAEERLPPDYFVAVAPEPSKPEVLAALEYLRSLVPAV